MIDSIRITHDELEGGTYRVLADFFRVAGIHVYGHIPGKNDSADECDICIYIPSKTKSAKKKITANTSEETAGATANAPEETDTAANASEETEETASISSEETDTGATVLEEAETTAGTSKNPDSSAEVLATLKQPVAWSSGDVKIPDGVLAFLENLKEVLSRVEASTKAVSTLAVNTTVESSLLPNEIEMNPIMDKETYKLAYLASNEMESDAQINWESEYRNYMKKYLLDCLDAIENVQSEEDTKLVKNDLNVLRAFADVFVNHDLLLHYNAYTVLYDDETILQEAQSAFEGAYKEFRDLLKGLPRSRFSVYMRMNLGKWINETCSFLGQRLIFDTKKCLDELDRLLDQYPSFDSVYVLKAYFAELDPKYDNLSEAYYQKALESMNSRSCGSYPCYRMGRYFEKIRKDKRVANLNYQLAYSMNRLEYRAVYKRVQSEKSRGDYLKAAESCREICHILHVKESANYLHPREQEYLFKAYNVLADIYGTSYKDSTEYESAERGRRQVLNAIRRENRMYKLLFGDRAPLYAEKMYHWLDNCKKY